LPPATAEAIQSGAAGIRGLSVAGAIEEVWFLAKQLQDDPLWSADEPPALDALSEDAQAWVWEQLARRAGPERLRVIQLRGAASRDSYLRGEVRYIWERWKYWRDQGAIGPAYSTGRRF